MTRQSLRLWVCTLATVAIAVAARTTAGQERFTSGQNVAPVYEGWMMAADGSYDMYFGYLNRNWTETPTVPIGEANSFSPGAADRGQPTFFYPRRHETVFKVNVPKDFGPKTELVWTVTANGKTDNAYGWLKPEWEIDALLIARNPGNQGGRTPEQIMENKPPSVTVDRAASVSLPNPLTLNASVTDDGLPTMVKKPSRGPGLPTLSAKPAPMNVASYKPPPMPRNDLSVMWIVYRGPAVVTFEPAGFQISKSEPAKTEGEKAKTGKTTTTATFTEPGEYRLRAIAADGVAMGYADLTVTVTGKNTRH